MKEVAMLTIGLCIGLYIGRLKAASTQSAHSCKCKPPTS